MTAMRATLVLGLLAVDVMGRRHDFTDEDAAKLEELMDREKIRDAMYRYARGIDRHDVDTLGSAYWPGATDQHGAFNGTSEEFLVYAAAVFATNPRFVHHITNILIQFSNTTEAVVESHFHALQRTSSSQVMLAGRYVDNFEKRGDEWRIAARVVVYDWMDEQDMPEGTEADRFGARQPIGSAVPTDPIYVALSAAGLY